jgi:hypothetical protein
MRTPTSTHRPLTQRAPLLALIAPVALSLVACMSDLDSALNIDERCRESASSAPPPTEGSACSCDPLSAQWVCVERDPVEADDGVAGGMEGSVTYTPPSDPQEPPLNTDGGRVEPSPSSTTPAQDIESAVMGQQEEMFDGGSASRDPNAPNAPNAPAPESGAASTCGLWEYATFETSSEQPCDGVRSYLRYDVTQSAWVGVRVCSPEDAPTELLRVYLSPNKATFYPVLANAALADAACALAGGGADEGVAASWLSDPDLGEADGLHYIATQAERLDLISGVPEGLSTGLASCGSAFRACPTAP